jgi:hypothetical protein
MLHGRLLCYESRRQRDLDCRRRQRQSLPHWSYHSRNIQIVLMLKIAGALVVRQIETDRRVVIMREAKNLWRFETLRCAQGDRNLSSNTWRTAGHVFDW